MASLTKPLSKTELMRLMMRRLKIGRSELARELGVEHQLITNTLNDANKLVKRKDTSLALVRMCLEQGMIDEAARFIHTYDGKYQADHKNKKGSRS